MVRRFILSFSSLLLLLAAGSGPARAVAVTTADGIGADAYVSTNNTAANYGGAAMLDNRKGGFYDTLTYLKFDLSSVSDPITAINLSLTLAGTNPTSVRVYGFADTSAAGNGWSESTLTYDNAPGLTGAGLSYLGTFSASGLGLGDTVSFSSTAFNTLLGHDSDGILSFLLQAYTPLNTAIQTASKENTTYAAPTLNLTLDTSNTTLTVPEPASMTFFGFGLIGLAAVRRRTKDT